MGAPSAAPGFFGKVSSHGDFVARRLPPLVQERWDGWLQSCIVCSKQQLAGDWLPHYLSSPVWRFAVAKDVLDENAWAGVLMPSVDRVGRHFPLLICAGAAGAVSVLDWLADASAWYGQIEELALTSLESHFQLDQFDAALSSMSALPQSARALAQESPAAPTVALAAPCWRFPSAGLAHLGAELPVLSSQIAQCLLAGHSLWWTDGSPAVTPSILLAHGMPAPASFAAMLDGGWQKNGWQGVA